MAEPVLVEFTQLNGQHISVNLSLIAHLEPSDAGTIITFTNGHIILVTESFDLVSEYLNPEKQAGE